MSALVPHRPWHEPAVHWARAHPTRALLLGGSAFAGGVVVSAGVAMQLGHLQPKHGWLVILGTFFLAAVVMVWRGLQVSERELTERKEAAAKELKEAAAEAAIAASPISVDSAYRMKHLDEPTAQYPIVKRTSTIYNVGHPADDKVMLGLMRDAETPTGEIRI